MCLKIKPKTKQTKEYLKMIHQSVQLFCKETQELANINHKLVILKSNIQKIQKSHIFSFNYAKSCSLNTNTSHFLKSHQFSLLPSDFVDSEC